MASSSALRIGVPAPLSRPIPKQLQSQINEHLLETGAVAAFHAALLHQAQASGWVDALRQRSLELLRSGECNTYGEVMKAIMEETRPKPQAQLTNGPGGDKRNGIGKNGVATTNDTKTDVRIPEAVVEKGIDALKKTLEGVVDVMMEE